MSPICRSRSLLSLSSLLALSFLSAACGSSATPTAKVAAPTAQSAPASQPEAQWVPGPSPDEIKHAVNTKNGDLRQCYIAGTFKNSQLAGTVNVTFTIDTKGKVSQTSDTGSSLPDPEVVQCVLGVFANLEFREGSTTPTEVTYPVKFGSIG